MDTNFSLPTYTNWSHVWTGVISTIYWGIAWYYRFFLPPQSIILSVPKIANQHRVAKISILKSYSFNKMDGYIWHRIGDLTKTNRLELCAYFSLAFHFYFALTHWTGVRTSMFVGQDQMRSHLLVKSVNIVFISRSHYFTHQIKLLFYSRTHTSARSSNRRIRILVQIVKIRSSVHSFSYRRVYSYWRAYECFQCFSIQAFELL